MAVVNDLITAGEGSLDFGNYELKSKTKKDNFEFQGDIYKIKTFNEITKLEKNGTFVYRAIQTYVEDGLAEEILKENVKQGDNVLITVRNDKVKFVNKTKRDKE